MRVLAELSKRAYQIL